MKLSIITINYNNLSGLRKTVESVFAQTCHDFEYIIIDGASTDGSKEYLDTIKNNSVSDEANTAGKLQITNYKLQIVSEPDTGIYNAMNKGIRASHGDYLLMLNSGDYLVDSRVVEHILPELDGTDIIQGNTICTKNGQTFVNRGYGKSDINYIDVQKGYFLHQASFCKRTLFEQYGYFDESYKIDGDTVFYIRCLGNGNATFRYVNQTIAYFEGGGMSDRQNLQWQQQRALEFQRWSTEEFSTRQWNTCIEYDKKGQLYDKLSRHKWAWNIAMLMSKIIDRMEK